MSKIIKLVESKLKQESWFSNEVLPLLQSYKDAGAIRQTDYISMAIKDREKDLADYIIDMDDREWTKIERMYLRESVVEAIDIDKFKKDFENILKKNVNLNKIREIIVQTGWKGLAVVVRWKETFKTICGGKGGRLSFDIELPNGTLTGFDGDGLRCKDWKMDQRYSIFQNLKSDVKKLVKQHYKGESVEESSRFVRGKSGRDNYIAFDPEELRKRTGREFGDLANQKQREIDDITRQGRNKKARDRRASMPKLPRKERTPRSKKVRMSKRDMEREAEELVSQVGGLDNISDEAIRDYALAMNIEPEVFADVVWNIYEPKTNICPDCEGSGEVNGRRCRRCNGKGKVFESVKESIKEGILLEDNYCNQCGVSLMGNEFFCPLCGAEVTPSESPICDIDIEPEDSMNIEPDLSVPGLGLDTNDFYSEPVGMNTRPYESVEEAKNPPGFGKSKTNEDCIHCKFFNPGRLSNGRCLDYDIATKSTNTCDTWIGGNSGKGKGESIGEATKGFTKNLLYKKGESFVCPTCGLHMPKYEGRYPSTCPSCKVLFEKPEKNKKPDEVEYLGNVAASSGCSEGIRVLGILNECCYIQIDKGKFAYKWESHTPQEIAERTSKLLEDSPICILSYILDELTLVEDGIENAFNYECDSLDARVIRRRILEGETEETANKKMETWWNSAKGKAIKKEQQERLKDIKEDEYEEKAMRIIQAPLLEVNRLKLLEKLIGQYSDQENIVGSIMLDETADEELVELLTSSLSFEYPYTRYERAKDNTYFIIIY